jgi:hypothetical protein
MGDDGGMTASRRAPNPHRRLFWRLGLLAALPILWFSTLRFGPALAALGRSEPAPAVFGFQARGLLLAQLGYPRTLEASLPPPAPGSNEDAQLRLMGYWTGREWSAKALSSGRLDGKALKVSAGKLDIIEIVGVTPARDYNGPQLCQVDYRVRWTYKGELDEFMRVRELVPYHLPRNLGIQKPGGVAAKQVTLERKGLGWSVQDAEELRGREAGLPNPNYRALAFFL